MKTGFFLVSFFSLLLFPAHVLAVSEYVLPYPPVMPGNKMYYVRQAGEYVQSLWHFGSFSRYKFNLEQADKYLVESKTLFEYKQYLLADKALHRSDYFLQEAANALERAAHEGKNTQEKNDQFRNAVEKHIEVLGIIKNTVPEHFAWHPEKTVATQLPLHKHIEDAIALRQSCL